MPESPARPEFFSSFDDAWRAFASGAPLVPIEEQRARMTAGRAQLLAFQAPITGPAVLAFAQSTLDALADIDGLLPLPDDLLHCSLRAAGFQVIAKQRPDDVLRQDVAKIAERAAAVVKRCPPAVVRVGPVNIFPDALILEVHDGGALAEIRRALGAATTHDAFVDAGAHYLPHVTLAFFEHASCVEALRERLPALRALPPVAATLARIDFVRWWLLDPAAAGEPPERDVIRTYALRA